MCGIRHLETATGNLQTNTKQIQDNWPFADFSTFQDSDSTSMNMHGGSEI